MAAAVWFAMVGSMSIAADKKPGAELDGAWRLQSTNGEKAPHADDADESTLMTFNLEEGTWKLEPRSDDGGFTFYGSFTVDETQTPKILDAVIQSDGGNSDAFAVYKIEGDVLTLCLRNDGQRPADFELLPNVHTLFVLKRHQAE
jgi:uncharacterized protein (TIGR03067 family)